MLSAYPTYEQIPTALFRVRLVTAIRQGRRDEAARLARSRTPDLVLDLRSDLLADLALLVGGDGADVNAAERDRVIGELHALPAVRRWIDRVSRDLTRELGVVAA
jgi:hypothetical protein